MPRVNPSFVFKPFLKDFKGKNNAKNQRLEVSGLVSSNKIL